MGDERIERLFGLWEELGIDEQGREDRSQTVLKHVTDLMDKWAMEEHVKNAFLADASVKVGGGWVITSQTIKEDWKNASY